MSAPATLSVADIRATLASGVKKFTFIKADGTERTVYGTLDADVIGRLSGDILPSVHRKAVSGNSKVTYFDVSKRDWGSFKVQSFIRFEEYGE